MNKAYLTAISRNKISKPVQFLKTEGLLKGTVLDYGCGRGFDAKAIKADAFDPHYFPEMPKKKYDTIICNYVLNVVDETVEKNIIKSIKKLLKKGGRAYISVRRDSFKEGINSKGTYQRYSYPNLTSFNKESGSYEMYLLEV
jgi:2-polyprenyl-3-methyl-5-hydroxy-6-metoxy-1,4-benzoquinol methylase